MQKNLAFIVQILVLAFALTGCTLINGTLGGGDGTQIVEPAKADAALYEQIGVPFRAYYEADDSVTNELKTSYNTALTTWQTTGSTWDIYDTIAPVYVYYLKTDFALSIDSVNVRRDTVLSWQLFLTSTTGETPENVFDPIAH